MEQLKDPATLLSIVNSIGLAGGIFYFYKENELIQVNITKISQTVTACVKKNGELDKGYREVVEGLKLLNDRVKVIDDKIKDMPSFENIRALDDDLEEIVETLHENHIETNLPSRRFRSGDRRDTRNIARENRELEQDRSYRPIQNNRRNEMSFRDRRPPTRSERERSDRSEKEQSELSNRHQTALDSKEDVLDELIGDVRKQSGY